MGEGRGTLLEKGFPSLPQTPSLPSQDFHKRGGQRAGRRGSPALMQVPRSRRTKPERISFGLCFYGENRQWGFDKVESLWRGGGEVW